MKIPNFIKEVIWAFYPPRYKQLADKKFRHSLKYMSTVLLIAFLIAGILFLPKIFMLKSTIQDELSKFETLRLDGNITQTAPVTIPKTNPWVVVDLNANRTLTKEILVIDKETVQYRFLGIKSIPREQLKEPSAYKPRASGFFAIMLLLTLPGIVLLLFLRMWLKYFFLIIAFGTFFFLISELSKFRLKWKQMLNIASHALTAVIFIEVIAAVFTTIFLLPIFRFLGVSVFAVTLLVFAGMMIFGIAGYHFEGHRRHR